MYLKKVVGPRAVSLPDGQIMTQADLPPARTRRWVASRKLAVVRGVIYGLISQEEALMRYQISHDEFREWLSAVNQDGIDGLKSTIYRKNKQL